jgi:hypothetical protein
MDHITRQGLPAISLSDFDVFVLSCSVWFSILVFLFRKVHFEGFVNYVGYVAFFAVEFAK